MMMRQALLLMLVAIAARVAAQEEPAATVAETTAEEAAPEAAAPEVAPPEAAAPEAAAAEAAAPEAAAAKGEEEEKCAPCPVISIAHYEAKYCEPVTDPAIDKCCPSSYICRSEEERNVPLDMCFYGNTTYVIGEDVPVNGPCRRGCICKASIDKGEPANVECGIVECPSLFSPPRPGCRNKFSLDECCEVEHECNEFVPEEEVVKENVTLRNADCFAEGLEYYIGDKVFFSKLPCQYCICSEDFSGAHGPNCTKMDCPMEYRDRQYLRDGCAPLYSKDVCCPTDWICPGSPQIIHDADLIATGEEDVSSHCKFGQMVIPRGKSFSTYDCHVSCSCTTPPEATCVRYSNCEVALAYQKAGFAP